MTDRELIRLVTDLVAIESVNPAFPGGMRGEAAVAGFVGDHWTAQP